MKPKTNDGDSIRVGASASAAKNGVAYVDRDDFVVEELAACILIMIVAYATTALTADRCSRGRNASGFVTV